MSKLLTDAELELMQLLWRHGPLTAREALAHLPDEPAYTTVSTFFRILVEKGFATPSKRGRAHVYSPCLSRSEYQVRKLEHVVNGLFDGSPLDLVRQLVRRQELSADEVAELKAFVDDLDEPGASDDG